MDKIKEIKDRAERLYEVRQLIAKKEEEQKAELEAMKTERDALQALLIVDMETTGLRSIKVESGDTFTQASKKGIEIVSESGALKWAMENMAVSVNKTLVAQKLKEATEYPDCFKAVETKYISVRKAKE